jgi:hypothetical protein
MSLPSRSIAASIVRVALLGSAVFMPAAAAEAAAEEASVKGLRLHLQFPPVPEGKAPQLEVTLENVGDSDLNVVLGYSLANGRHHHPAALRLVVHGQGNQPRTLHYAQVRVAGRIDPLVVPLSVGASHTVRCGLDQFVDSQTGAPVDLSAAEHPISAVLVGEPVSHANSDTQGLMLMPYWQGTVQSNEVRLRSTQRTED